MPQKAAYTKLVKSSASAWGFEYCGIAKAVTMDDDARRLENWLAKAYHGSMQYMENYVDIRTNPALLVPGAKSVITLLKNYFPSRQQHAGAPKVSKYAYGKDYHFYIKESLKSFLEYLRQNIGEFQGRGFVDSAPVLERSWAQRSGLGWIGKNGNLITKQQGSFFFIATLITDLELEYDDPLAKDFCGSCRRCIDACPTEAIQENKVINGSQCISYFTIELKDLLIPDEMKNKFEGWLFGCDICQDVCPWNRFSKPTKDPALEPIPAILDLSNAEWLELSEEAFQKTFSKSPLKRSKYAGIRRNLQFLQRDT